MYLIWGFPQLYSENTVSFEDNTSELQNLILNSPGKTINISPKTYHINSTLYLPSDINIDFSGSTLVYHNSTNTPLIQNADTEKGNSNIILKNCIIKINSRSLFNRSYSLLRFEKLKNSVFSNIQVIGMGYRNYVVTGLWDFEDSSNCEIINCKLSDAFAEGLAIRNSYNFTVSGGEFHGCKNGSGIATILGSGHVLRNVKSYDNAGSNFSINSTYTLIENCISYNSTKFSGITLGHPKYIASHSMVKDCKIYNIAGTGIYIDGASSNITISNTNIENTKSEGIKAGGGSSNIKIIDNVIRRTLTGLYLNSSNSFVERNIIDNNTNSGIVLNNSSGVHISRNTIKNNNISGISFVQNSKDNIIEYNEIYNDNKARTQKRGIYINKSSVRNIINNNYFNAHKFYDFNEHPNNSFKENSIKK